MEIQDFGEKIGGAKKDLWRERNLLIDDLTDMNDAEKQKFITKDNVWKKPNYQELVDSGIPKRVVYFMKLIRDNLPTKPVIEYFYSRSPENVKEKQEGYIEFMSKIRDFTLGLKTENDVLDFYDNFLSHYLTRLNSFAVSHKPEAHDCINNKLLSVSKVKDLRQIDNDIKKKQFLFTEQGKILSEFEFITFDNKNVYFDKESVGNKNVLVQNIGWGKRFFYPQGEFEDPEKWNENTVFICKDRKIIKNNISNLEGAKQYILENFSVKQVEKKNTRKKMFKPIQLEHIIRNGEDYRENANITGDDMIQKFNFKGGEFGNWLNENDRQESLNYGYDALLDLSKALNIAPSDISLGNRLSIAFGSRGSGNAMAHYEPLREVINLTKMKGAGSLAHEWGHAFDDIIGKQAGYKGFMTENSANRVITDLLETMKYKTICNDESSKMQIEKYEKTKSKLRSIVNSLFPNEYLNEDISKQKDLLIEQLIEKSNIIGENPFYYYSHFSEIKELSKLSDLRKNTVGRDIPKNEKRYIAQLQDAIFSAKNKIGKPERVETEFYKNSKLFDNSYSKDSHGYWQSNTEMFARAFACYVHDKLENRSDYLCGHSENAIGVIYDESNESKLIAAFPKGDERKAINQKIDALIEFAKERSLLHDFELQEQEETIEMG
ncbi:MAG: hypothetical protein IJ220_04540 [Clostridia bacterium]|nr:hypothetical protein [Clostridia bacterium]